MSSPESQISAIPPERYGDRFIKFIAGVTKTRERAEYEKAHFETLEASDSIGQIGHEVRKAEGTLDDPLLAGVNVTTPRIDLDNPVGTDSVIREAERQADESKRRGSSEDNVPNRSISAVRESESDRQDLTLPVIGEAAESGSATSTAMTPQRSTESFRGRTDHAQPPYTVVLGNANMANQSLGEVPPPTPPKTDGPVANEEFERGRISSSRPPPTPPKDEQDGAHLSRTSTRISRSSLDKALPPVPQATKVLSASPARASEAELERSRSHVSGF